MDGRFLHNGGSGSGASMTDRGVFVPAFITRLAAISSGEKFLLAAIDNVCSERDICDLSNRDLGEWIGFKPASVRRSIAKFARLNLIHIDTFEGKRAIETFPFGIPTND